jgi:hypothetical protein
MCPRGLRAARAAWPSGDAIHASHARIFARSSARLLVLPMSAMRELVLGQRGKEGVGARALGRQVSAAREARGRVGRPRMEQVIVIASAVPSVFELLAVGVQQQLVALFLQ